MNDTIRILIIWAIIVIVHELGHILACKYYKYNPNIKIKWWGIVVGENIEIRTPIQSYLILIWGVIAGMIPLYAFFFNDNQAMIIYLAMSSVDLVQIFLIMMMKKEELKGTWLQYYQKRVEKLTQIEKGTTQ